MGTGRLSDWELEKALALVEDIPGDYAEIGVYRGDLFYRLARYADVENRIAHAFDSFAGMDEPGEHDVPDDNGPRYDKGAMRCGLATFIRGLNSVPIASYCWRLWPGYIPDGFEDFDRTYSSEPRFAFAYVDVDHCEPTRAAIEWVWPRIVPGGVLGCDDYFSGRTVYASPAIDDFLATVHAERWMTDNGQVFVRRPATVRP